VRRAHLGLDLAPGRQGIGPARIGQGQHQPLGGSVGSDQVDRAPVGQIGDQPLRDPLERGLDPGDLADALQARAEDPDPEVRRLVARARAARRALMVG
jgi:hypothetical protein